MKIVVFGSGNIGRGLIPEVFKFNDSEYTFLDINQEVVDKINKEKKYVINKFNSEPCIIENIKAFNLATNFDEIKKEILNADVITTAVGFENLVHVANFLNKFNDSDFDKEVDFVCFENNVRPASHLKSLVKLTKINFIDAVVDRIIPNSLRDTLDVICEPYYKVILENKNIKNQSVYKNCQLVEVLEEYIKLKLFMINGLHFIVAVLGHNAGYNKIHLTLSDQNIMSRITKLKDIYVKYIPEIVNVSGTEVAKIFDDSISRFSQKELNDDNERIARNMILKLQKDNRVIPIYLKSEKDLNDKNFMAQLIKDLYQYNNPNDKDSVEISNSIKQVGLENTIIKYSQIIL